MAQKIEQLEEAERASRGLSRSQMRRARRALDLLEEHAWLVPESGWLLINARNGDALRLAAMRHLMRPGENWGTDSSLHFIQAARVRHPLLAEWIEAKETSIPLENGAVNLAMLFDGVKDIGATLLEMRRLLSLNSLALVALAAPGEDESLKRALVEVFKENPAWHKKELPEHPLAQSELKDVLLLAEGAGFLPFFAATFYEPVGYSSPSLRLEEIEQEGRDAWLEFFKEEKREEAWLEIKETWLDNLPPGNGAHRHRAFSSYLLLRAI